jgi:tripartite-type tricarboxylate transporter receptor subunit TctC
VRRTVICAERTSSTMNASFSHRLHRRGLLRTAVAAAVATITSLVMAQGAPSFPQRPLKIVLMFPAGGGSADPQVRALADRLKTELGQAVLVENRVGGGGVIAAEFVKGEPADGHTILWSGVALMGLTPKFNSTARYSSADFVPVASLGTTPNVLLARREFPVEDLKDLAQMARSQPGKLSYGTWGPGSVTHVGGEWFSNELGITLNAVPYRGEVPLLQDMLGGHVDLGWSSVPSALPYLKAGQLKALAISSSARDPSLPQVRTFAEQGVPNFSIQGWTGLFVRAGTPPDVVTLLHTKIAKILQEPEMQARAASAGYHLPPLTIEQFKALINADLAKMTPTLDRLAPQIRQ